MIYFYMISSGDTLTTVQIYYKTNPTGMVRIILNVKTNQMMYDLKRNILKMPLHFQWTHPFLTNL